MNSDLFNTELRKKPVSSGNDPAVDDDDDNDSDEVEDRASFNSTVKTGAAPNQGLATDKGPATVTPPVTGSGSFGKGRTATVTVDPAERIRHGQS